MLSQASCEVRPKCWRRVVVGRNGGVPMVDDGDCSGKEPSEKDEEPVQETSGERLWWLEERRMKEKGEDICLTASSLFGGLLSPG